METKFKTELQFNHDLDIELTNGSHFNSLKDFVVDRFPHFSKILERDDLLFAYVEPKTFLFLEKENEYRSQGYPTTGVRELAYIEMCTLIYNELESHEENALEELFIS
jgi:hypothetical protein